MRCSICNVTKTGLINRGIEAPWEGDVCPRCIDKMKEKVVEGEPILLSTKKKSRRRTK